MTISMRRPTGVSWTSPARVSCRHPQLTTRRRRVPMKQHLFVAGAAVLALGFTASMASAANCAYEHPKSAKSLKSSMVQAMVSCNNPGGNTPNATTEGGVPTCAPPETFHEQAGSPPGGWTWDEGKGK